MRGWFLFFLGGLLGIVAGASGMLIAFPFLFPPPVVAEAAPAGTTVSRLGTFRFDDKAPGRDFVHWADGTGAVYQADRMTVVRFDENFRAGPGPNYWIYLNTVPVGEETAFNADAQRRKIAPLKSFTGGQNYVLPTGVDLSKYRTLTIWCESFSVYIGSATLSGAP